jgi:dipeptidase D
VKGLNGGHSGMQIHEGLGNANKIMNRVLFETFEEFDLRVSAIDGGSLRNAIPRESVAIVALPQAKVDEFLGAIEKTISDIKSEFATTEKNLQITVEKTDTPDKVMAVDAQQKLISSLYTAHNGVYRMSADMQDLVETSNNIARVIVKDGEIMIGCLTRSSVESSKFDLANALKSAFSLAGYDVTFTGSYPGWTPNVNSEILKILVDIYKRQNGSEPKVVACHAGLECGILGTNYPGMDMISFGPTIHGAHSPDERASISSTQKYWKFVLEILQSIPEKSK